MKGKTCVVTGSTSGIGKAIAIGLARRGARVVLAGHDRVEGERALADVAERTGSETLELHVADFSTLDAVRGFSAAIRSRHPVIDVLVNNAGVLSERPETTPDGLPKIWAVNYYAPFLLTHLLLDRLGAAPQGRIVNTASVAHRWGRLSPSRPHARRRFGGVIEHGALDYFDTKLALVIFTRRLAVRLGDGVTCNCFHPGIIGTDIAAGGGAIGRLMRVGRPMLKTPERGARTAIYLASAQEVAPTSGEYFVDERVRRPSRRVHDEQTADALWQSSVDVTGVGG